jgi:hypothetical protein
MRHIWRRRDVEYFSGGKLKECENFKELGVDGANI